MNLIDRYIMRRQVLRQRFQLVGVTAMWIACKYQEIYPPLLNDLVFMTDNAYTNAEVMQMETRILQVLQFNITFPTSLSFLETYMRAINCIDLTTELYAKFVLDLCLTDLQM